MTMNLTSAEWIVMNALWRIAPATAREILEELPEDTKWAYTTVKTILTRLEQKGVVNSVKVVRSAQYRPLLSRRSACGRALASGQQIARVLVRKACHRGRVRPVRNPTRRRRRESV